MVSKQFTIYLENRPGELARLTTRLAKENVNIEGMSSWTSSDVGLVQIVVSNATKTRKVLNATKVSFTSQDVVVIPLADQPGSLSQVAEKLAKAGVNINYLYATGSSCKSKGSCHSYAIVSAENMQQLAKVVK